MLIHTIMQTASEYKYEALSRMSTKMTYDYLYEDIKGYNKKVKNLPKNLKTQKKTVTVNRGKGNSKKAKPNGNSKEKMIP